MKPFVTNFYRTDKENSETNYNWAT